MQRVSKLLIELDCLLDTRLAVLATMDLQKSIEMVDQHYYSRLQDIFKGFDTEEFNKAYASRDKGILKNAIFTPLVKYIKEFTVGTQMSNTAGPTEAIPVIVVNLYPYVLTDAETDVLMRALAATTDQLVDIESVYLSPEEVTPKYVYSNYDIIIMYHYLKWMEIHAENKNFESSRCASTTLHGPALFFNGLPDAADVELLRRSNHDPFTALEILAEPMVSLKLLPVEDFCLSHKIGTKE